MTIKPSKPNSLVERLFLSSFHVRVVTLFLLMLFIIQGGDLLIVNATVYKNAKANILNEIKTGSNIFGLLRNHYNQSLHEAASILASDYAFRQAIATHDRDTIISVLENHGARINAKRMILVGLDNRIIADIQRPSASGQVFSFPELTVSNDSKATIIELTDNHAYELLAVPVKAPLPIAWVVIGFTLDKKLADNLKQLSNLDVSFIGKSPSTPWKVLTTTLAQAAMDRVMASLDNHKEATVPTEEANIFASQDYENFIVPKNQSDGTTFAAVLHRALPEAMETTNKLRWNLFWLMLLMLAPSVAFAMLLAGSVTKPVIKLASTAHGMAQGDYSKSNAMDRHDEIGKLALAFDSMRQGIQTREEKILKLAFRDSLTNLPNRTFFTERLEQSLVLAKQENRPLTVMLIDMNRFKEVNNVLGHHMGDQLLQKVALRLSRTFDGLSDTIARLGGDEFAILLRGGTCASALDLVRSLLPGLEQPAKIEGYQVDVGLSIGIACFPENGVDAVRLMQCADIAMYSAKRQTNGVAIYNPLHDNSTAYNLSIVGDLRRASQENEFVVYYQPKVRFADNKVYAVEALVRWNHPERGLMHPDIFVPIAEQTGHIRTITRWVLDKALAQCALWRGNGINIEVAVNLSVKDLEDNDLPCYISQLLSRYRLPPAALALEITEGALMQDPEHVMGIANLLNKLDIKLSIDDYGSGFSSLSYIKKFPVKELKIDKAFVIGMMNNPDDITIVRSTVELGHNMGLSVVAEGVENQVIWNLLRDMGCDVAQGFFTSKPLTPAELEYWLGTTLSAQHSP